MHVINIDNAADTQTFILGHMCADKSLYASRDLRPSVKALSHRATLPHIELWRPNVTHSCRGPVPKSSYIFCFAPDSSAKYCDYWWECLSLCLSARLVNFRSLTEKLHQIFCACWLWSWLDPSLAALRYVMQFRFRGWRHVFTQWVLWRVMCIPRHLSA